MAHEKVYAICKNKCFVETMTKKQIEQAIKVKLSEVREDTQINHISSGLTILKNVSNHSINLVQLSYSSNSGAVIKSGEVIAIDDTDTTASLTICSVSSNETIIIFKK